MKLKLHPGMEIKSSTIEGKGCFKLARIRNQTDLIARSFKLK
jgi:hypothetical protein